MPHWWGTPIDEKLGIGDADQGVGHYPCWHPRYSGRRVFVSGEEGSVGRNRWMSGLMKVALAGLGLEFIGGWH